MGKDDQAPRIQGVALLHQEPVVEREEIERADAFDATQVGLGRIDVAADQMAQIVLLEPMGGFFSEPPIEKEGRRLRHGYSSAR